MPKISELHNPSTSYTVTGQEELIVNTTSLSTVALSASDLIGATVDAVTTGQIQNFKSTHTDFKANSADYDNTKTTLNTYSGNWNYVATNSASLKANTTIDGKLTVGGTTTDPDNQLTVIGSISATGTSESVIAECTSWSIASRLTVTLESLDSASLAAFFSRSEPLVVSATSISIEDNCLTR